MADNTETPPTDKTETPPEDNKLTESVNTDDATTLPVEGENDEPDKDTKPADEAKDKDKKGKKEKNVPLSRFLKQNKELQDARAEAAELKRLMELGKQAKDDTKPLTKEDIERLAREEASRISQQERFNEKSNEIYGAGVKQYSKQEFDGAIDTIKTIGLIPADMIDVLADLGDGHKVLKHLSEDLDETERLFALSPTKRAIELTKLHGKVTAVPKKQISNAPDPIKPIGGGGKMATVDIYDPKIPVADRIKEMRRQEQIKWEKRQGKR